MVATDAAGVLRGYLASEENFATLKTLETKNLLVPVVGNFAGPKALRAVGAWLKAHNGMVSAFYLSNVEQYLNMDGIWMDFCANASRLPIDDSSQFIRSYRGGNAPGFGGGASPEPGALSDDGRPEGLSVAGAEVDWQVLERLDSGHCERGIGARGSDGSRRKETKRRLPDLGRSCCAGRENRNVLLCPPASVTPPERPPLRS